MNGISSVVVTLSLPRITAVSITDDSLPVDLEDGQSISVPIGWYPRLAHGTAMEKENVQIVGAGFGLHSPDLDEDIDVEGILLGKRSGGSSQSFERWLRSRK